MMGITSLSEKEIGNLSLGSLGFDVVSNETKSPGDGLQYFALVVDADATFSAISNIGDDLPSATRVAGSVVFGNFASVTVIDAGRVLAYKAPAGG